jgi:hypothetical protein
MDAPIQPFNVPFASSASCGLLQEGGLDVGSQGIEQLHGAADVRRSVAGIGDAAVSGEEMDTATYGTVKITFCTTAAQRCSIGTTFRP